MLCTCETQGTQHMISMQKLKFSSLSRAEFSLRRLENYKDPGVVSRSWGQEHSLQPCCVYQLFLLFVWFLVQSNIALFKPTKQSSAYSDSRFYPSSNAVDGNRDTDISKCTHTNEENNPWWRVDLGRVEPVVEVIILNRDSHETRLDGAEIRVGR